MKTILKTVAAALAARRSPERRRASAEPVKVGFAAGSLSALLPRRTPPATGSAGKSSSSTPICAEAKLDCVHDADRLGRHHPGADDQEDRRRSSTRCRSPTSARRRSTSPTSITTRRPPSSAPRTRSSTPRRKASRARSSASRCRPCTPPTPRSTSPTRAEIKEYQTQDEANQDLAAGRIDATQADSIALDAFLKSDQGKACCDLKGMVAPDLEILGPGVGAGVRKDDTALKDKINAAIKAIRANGKYARDHQEVLRLRHLRRRSRRSN